MKTFRDFIDDIQESSMSRLKSQSDKGGTAVMSASRGDKSGKENRARAKKLDKDIGAKKQKLNDEIEKELAIAEKEIKDLKKNSTSDIANIASETTAEIIKQITTADVNKSNVSAVVNDVIKKEMGKHI